MSQTIITFEAINTLNVRLQAMRLLIDTSASKDLSAEDKEYCLGFLRGVVRSEQPATQTSVETKQTKTAQDDKPNVETKQTKTTQEDQRDSSVLGYLKVLCENPDMPERVTLATMFNECKALHGPGWKQDYYTFTRNLKAILGFDYCTILLDRSFLKQALAA